MMCPASNGMAHTVVGPGIMRIIGVYRYPCLIQYTCFSYLIIYLMNLSSSIPCIFSRKESRIHIHETLCGRIGNMFRH